MAAIELFEDGKGISVGSWHFRVEKGPIGSSEELEALGKTLNLKLPSMVFLRSSVDIDLRDDASGAKQGFRLKFDATNALAGVGSSDPKLQVMAAKDWVSRRTHKDVQMLESPSDWTFTTKYDGDVLDGVKEIRKGTEKKINYDKLRRRDIPVRYFNESILFEDELDDNGVSIYTIRMRVSEGFFLILSRFHLRVDGVFLRVYDTRYYHEFGTNFILKEQKKKELDLADAPGLALEIIKDVERVIPHLKTVEARTDEYILS